MEAQDFSDFFENINPDAPEILSMPSYCDLLRDLQAHAHGYTILKLSLLTTTLRVLPATLRPVITPSNCAFMHPCNTCFLYVHV